MDVKIDFDPILMSSHCTHTSKSSHKFHRSIWRRKSHEFSDRISRMFTIVFPDSVESFSFVPAFLIQSHNVRLLDSGFRICACDSPSTIYHLSALFLSLGWWNGRHVRLRGVCRKACGFKSRPEHHLIYLRATSSPAREGLIKSVKRYTPIRTLRPVPLPIVS